MMDIVVVPTISLNPKKAKKKLKKAARMHEDSEEPQLPVNTPLFGKECISTPAPSFTKEPAAKAPSPKTSFAKAPVPRTQPTRVLFAAQAAPATPAASCAAEALRAPETAKRSWFDITEEDDDDFLDSSLWSGPSPVVA